ncbi:hypothetical protein RRG08_021348 [Elysia crispata]|uniref:Reverse transcriptase domain-containing protein n=1 Tax=Elysia crispata TaxID=231223 RepID=A0AAE1AYC1_9GAST|nr:hypothetical protein RRG08_021348 [Elysia crispata]
MVDQYGLDHEQLIHWDSLPLNAVSIVSKKKALQGQPKAQIRVCGDYSVTVNPQLETHRHPIPKPEDLIRRLGGGHYFSKIDLADAYNQIQLSPASQEKLALGTHR